MSDDVKNDTTGTGKLVLHILTLPGDEEIVEHLTTSDPLLADRLIKPGELADWLGISVGALAQFRHRGEGGPAWVEVGKSVRYRVADVVEWLRTHRKFRTAA